MPDPLPNIMEILEGRRIEIDNQDYVDIRFDTRHDTLPIVTTLLEPATDDGTMTAYIVYTTQTWVGIQFSAGFSGYLHLQAFSQRIPS